RRGLLQSIAIERHEHDERDRDVDQHARRQQHAHEQRARDPPRGVKTALHLVTAIDTRSPRPRTSGWYIASIAVGIAANVPAIVTVTSSPAANVVFALPSAPRYSRVTRKPCDSAAPASTRAEIKRALTRAPWSTVIDTRSPATVPIGTRSDTISPPRILRFE